MKVRSLFVLALVLLFAVSAFADKPVKRTVIVQDGKVITDNIEGIDLPEFLADRELLAARRGFLGVSLTNLTPELREHLGASKTAGAIVGSVEEGSPADKAGLRVGDIIVAVDGKDVDSAMDLRRALADKKDGDTTRIDIIRNRARQTVVATVVEREGDAHFRLLEKISGPEWRGRVMAMPNCLELQSKLKDLETKMKDLEKRLAK